MVYMDTPLEDIFGCQCPSTLFTRWLYVSHLFLFHTTGTRLTVQVGCSFRSAHRMVHPRVGRLRPGLGPLIGRSPGGTAGDVRHVDSSEQTHGDCQDVDSTWGCLVDLLSVMKLSGLGVLVLTAMFFLGDVRMSEDAKNGMPLPAGIHVSFESLSLMSAFRSTGLMSFQPFRSREAARVALRRGVRRGVRAASARPRWRRCEETSGARGLLWVLFAESISVQPWV